MSLYADYKLELENKIVIENEKGFVLLGFHPGACYIEEVYVKPEFRNLGETKNFMLLIKVEAQRRDCKYLFGSAIPSKNSCTESLKMQFSHGFKIHSTKENFILLAMELT